MRNVTKTRCSSDKDVKNRRKLELAGLETNDKFIFEPPAIQLDSNGVPMIDKNSGLPLRIGKPTKPFTGPIIRNALRILFFEKKAKFLDIEHKDINDHMLTFITVLVCILIRCIEELIKCHHNTQLCLIYVDVSCDIQYWLSFQNRRVH